MIVPSVADYERVRDLRPRGRLLENVAILRGTARHDDEATIRSWYEWISSPDRVTSDEFLDGTRSVT